MQSTLIDIPIKNKNHSFFGEIPSFFPYYLKKILQNSPYIDKSGVLRIRTKLSSGERNLLKRKKPILVSDWAEQNRVLDSSSIKGRWRNLYTPYLVGIMNTAGKNFVETVVICKSPQTGGSEAGHNLVGYCIDRMPGPVLYVFPDELTAKENARDRIIPMINSSPRLKKYKTGTEDDTTVSRINLMHMPIYLGWSGSASRLGNKSIRILILDELDKYKNPKHESRSEDLAEKRTTTWRGNRIIVKISTPTIENGPIWQAFTKDSNAIFDYYVSCPHCAFRQLMQFDRISWPDKPQNDQVERYVEGTGKKVLSEKSAYYICEHCGSTWHDAERDKAVRGGEWRERSTHHSLETYLSLHKPIKVGFHIPAWISYFVSLSEVAYAFLKWKETDNREFLRDFLNQYCALPMEEVFEKREEESILALCDDRPRGAVPGSIDGKERISVLLATVDTQKTYFRYNIRAFGYGMEEESWLVATGNVDTFTALEDVLFHSEYPSATGEIYKVKAVMIDAMGTKTRDVYSWAIKHRGRVFPWQGVNSLSQPYTPTMIEYFPDDKANKVKIPGGMTLYRCDVTFFKSDLSNKLSIHPDDPGAFHLHTNEKNELDNYAKEMCAESWDDEKQMWVNAQRKANHAWDTEVMHRALAYILNIRHRKRPDTREIKKIKQSREQTLSVSQRIRRR